MRRIPKRRQLRTLEGQLLISQLEFLFGALAIVAALVGFAWYQWTRRRRKAQVAKRIDSYLQGRYDVLPSNLHINCTDDQLWPVLVTFDTGGLVGTLHLLQFSCSADPSTFRLHEEKQLHRSAPH